MQNPTTKSIKINNLQNHNPLKEHQKLKFHGDLNTVTAKACTAQ